ncbi:MAG: HEAT repeat domain-containing protein [Elusimicrobia bacterium]|nr:HEAT repeat domain-containing protein [Elusimicrobiota bacterium]
MNQRLYPTGSRSVEEVVAFVQEEINAFLQKKENLTLSRNGHRFFVDKTEVVAASLLVQVFEEHGIQGVTFDAGCPGDEIRILVEGLSGKRFPDRSFADWLDTKKVTHIHVTDTRVMEVSGDEAVVAKGLSQFHSLESNQEMRASLKASLEYIDTIPEETMKATLRQHLAERLVLMEATLLKELFDADVGFGSGGASVLEDVLAALHQGKLLELLNETLRWELKLQTTGKGKEMEREHEKLKTMVLKLSKCASARKIPRAVYEKLAQRGLLETVPEYAAMETSQDLRMEVDRLIGLTDSEFIKGGGRGLAEMLGSLFAAGFQDRAKDVVQRVRSILLEGEATLRERAAQWARRFLPVLWTYLRDDLGDRLRDAFLTEAQEERAVPVVHEVLGALTDDFIHNYRARRTRTALEVAEKLCSLRGQKESLPKERPEISGACLKRALEELMDIVVEDIHSKENERQEAGRRLLSHVGDLAIPAFVKIVIDSRDRALRSLAAEQLGQYGVPGAKALASELNMGNTTYALLNVVSVLGTVGGEEILDGLGTLIHYPDPDLRHAIVRILARLPGDKSSELAVKFLGDKKESVRRLAADVLGDQRYKPAVMPLLRLLRQASVAEAETVCLVLGRLGDPSAAESLGRLLKEKNYLFSKDKSARETVRIRAAWALAQLGAAGQAQLLPYIGDSNPSVRDIALKGAS